MAASFGAGGCPSGRDASEVEKGSAPPERAEGKEGVFYCSYIGVEELFRAIDPEKELKLRTHHLRSSATLSNGDSGGEGSMRQHDELFFIKMHQVYELWFHQITAELHSLIAIFRPATGSYKPEHVVLANAEIIIGRLTRVRNIFKLLEPQITLMETLTPNSFLNFRDLLQRGSGFQSWQFRVLENVWGLTKKQRQHVEEEVKGKLCNFTYREKIDNDRERIGEGEHELDARLLSWSEERENSLLNAVEAWLESLFESLDYDDQGSDGQQSYWKKYCQLFGEHAEASRSDESRWSELHKELEGGFEDTSGSVSVKGKPTSRKLSPKAMKGALFILANRGLPLMHVMNEILQLLLDIDNCLMGWRFKHRQMVWRIIGRRQGTGQIGRTSATPDPNWEKVSGVRYLGETLEDNYRVYLSLANLSTFLLPRITYTRQGQLKANLWPHTEENLVRRLEGIHKGASEYFQGHHGLREFDKLQKPLPNASTLSTNS